jgi:hypothetical protein
VPKPSTKPYTFYRLQVSDTERYLELTPAEGKEKPLKEEDEDKEDTEFDVGAFE